MKNLVKKKKIGNVIVSKVFISTQYFYGFNF